MLASTEGFLPAIEVAPQRPGVIEKKYSFAHMIAVQKSAGGYVVFGSKPDTRNNPSACGESGHCSPSTLVVTLCPDPRGPASIFRP
ncbi:hypothetical protein, partial [Amaricoccus sp. W119]|uniref:hypothetical protein n=1 Tax=Amaricoccus sp. W119 TaxID=3391833 RepID=UPI0039A72954